MCGLRAGLKAKGRLVAGGKPGRGGISRGRGDAQLNYENDTEGETDAFKARKLPPGRRPSTEWERLGLRRATPQVDPKRAGEAGTAGDTGSGEASWRRKLAPRHRDVVRKFFSAEKK